MKFHSFAKNYKLCERQKKTMNVRKVNAFLFTYRTQKVLEQLPNEIRSMIGEFVPLCENWDCFSNIVGAGNYCSNCDIIWCDKCDTKCSTCDKRLCLDNTDRLHEPSRWKRCKIGNCGVKYCDGICGTSCYLCYRSCCWSCAKEKIPHCKLCNKSGTCIRCGWFNCARCQRLFCRCQIEFSIYHESVCAPCQKIKEEEWFVKYRCWREREKYGNAE
jgi:hypothetical protein